MNIMDLLPMREDHTSQKRETFADAVPPSLEGSNIQHKSNSEDPKDEIHPEAV
jgi:hypothetical protein